LLNVLSKSAVAVSVYSVQSVCVPVTGVCCKR